MLRFATKVFFVCSVCTLLFYIGRFVKDDFLHIFQKQLKVDNSLKLIRKTTNRDAISFNEETQEYRNNILKLFCTKHRYDTSLKYDENFMYTEQRKALYCHIPKVACTTWKKIMAYFMGYVKSPWEVESMTQLYGFQMHYLKDVEANDKALKKIKNEYFSFMFSRHPYDRLFSAYRNKFLNPLNNSKGFLKHYGPMIVSNDVNPLAPHPTRKQDGLFIITFEQFVKFVLKAGPDFDNHWRPQTRICHICDYKYTYLGKFETLQKDANYILKELGDTLTLPLAGEYKKKTTKILQSHFATLPKYLMSQIYQFYKNDFEAFGYDPLYYF